MKILYSAGNRFGAGLQLQRVLEKINNKYEVKVAAYLNSSLYIKHIDWTLDALHFNVLGTKKKNKLIKLFNSSNIKSINLQSATTFVKEVGDFNPDLIISDFEPISAHIAKLYNKELWYCSPLHLLDGITNNKHGSIDYQFKLETAKELLKQLPKANKYFIYSCFADIKIKFNLNKGYSFLSPYYKNNNDSFKIENINRINNIKYIYDFLNSSKHEFFITDGCTDNIADAFHINKKILICPTLNDYENLMNATFIEKYNIGSDLGQIELMEKYSIDRFEKSFEKKYNTNYFETQNNPQLHERIEEYASYSV